MLCLSLICLRFISSLKNGVYWYVAFLPSLKAQGALQSQTHSDIHTLMVAPIRQRKGGVWMLQHIGWQGGSWTWRLLIRGWPLHHGVETLCFNDPYNVICFRVKFGNKEVDFLQTVKQFSNEMFEKKIHCTTLSTLEQYRHLTLVLS